MRYTVSITYSKRTKDYAITLTDNRSKQETLSIGGYDSEASAKRGFGRYAKTLFRSENIAVSWKSKIKN